MGQVRTVEYNTPITSFKRNQSLIGPIEPGRYRGWDTAAEGTGSGIVIDITHDNTGIQKTDINLNLENKRGVVVTPQGVTITDDDPLSFTIDDNNGNSQIRYDLIIIEHEFTQVTGGQAAIYSVIRGPLESATVPALPNPEKQIILGIVELAAGATDYSGITYSVSNSPALGNDNWAHQERSNTFSEVNYEAKSFQPDTLTNIPIASGANTIDLGAPRNIYRLSPATGNSLDPDALIDSVICSNKEGGFKVGTPVTFIVRPSGDESGAIQQTIGLHLNNNVFNGLDEFYAIDSNDRYNIPNSYNWAITTVVTSYNSSTGAVKFAVTGANQDLLTTRALTWMESQKFLKGITTGNLSLYSPEFMMIKVNIGNWDMDTTDSVNVAVSGLPAMYSNFKTDNIVDIKAIIYRDNDDSMVPFSNDPNNEIFIGSEASGGNITLTRSIGGPFDSNSSYNDNINRGHLWITYIPDHTA